ncbi:MAG: DUF975 family protein [Lachnospiraceae bacterium]|nr:DUF975 family protein [Lachnospiraceae bacterium]
MKSLKPRVLKREARIKMQGNYGTLVAASLIVFGCTFLLNIVLTLLAPASSTLLSFLLYLAGLLIINTLYNVLSAGVSRLYLNLATDQPFSLRDLFYAFSTHPEPIAVYSAVSLAVEFGVLYLILFLASGARYLSFWLLIILILAALLLLLWFVLTFSCFLFLHARDPRKSAKELFGDCIHLMKGHRLALFRLSFTFLGVLILCILSFGIGLLFALPYMQMTVTLFYEWRAEAEEQ